jgi:putative endonuclease
MFYTVYILFSERCNKHYTGFTSDFSNRLMSHNEFGMDWTKSCRPWRVIFTKQFDEKKQAMAYEKWLKTGVGREFIKTLAH